MSEANLRRVLGLVAILAVGYGGVLLLGDGGGAGEPVGPVPDALRRAAGSGLDSARIVGGGDTVLLRRGVDGWRVNGHRAEATEVGSLRRALEPDAPPELASRNPENHPSMGVDSAGARRLVLWTGEAGAVELLVGDRGPYASSAYARVPGTAPVHLVRGELGSLARQGPEAWRDRTVVAVDTARAGAVVVERPDTTYRLERTSGAWRIGSAPADPGGIRDLLGLLAGLEATGFAPDTAGEASPDRRVLVLGREATDTLASLRLFRTGPEDRPRDRVVAEGREAVFELPGSRADRLAPPPGDLRGGGDADGGAGDDRDGGGDDGAGA